MKIKIGKVCGLSNKESEIHVGSAFCKKCRYFNGICETDKMQVSCLTPLSAG